MAFIVFFIHNPFWWLGVLLIVFCLGSLCRMYWCPVFHRKYRESYKVFGGRLVPTVYVKCRKCDR